VNDGQRSSTRRIVRLRDKSCLVTGEEVLPRKRGGNFTGFEVAHIFPLMGVGQVLYLLTLFVHTLT
jgi:hypothetical protein